jgi:hypothetical protein
MLSFNPTQRIYLAVEPVDMSVTGHLKTSQWWSLQNQPV